MTNANALPYFLKAIAASGRLEPWGMSSKMYAACIYMNENLTAEALAILEEIANVDLYQIKSPPYAGPYEYAWSSLSFSEKVDAARQRANQMRYTARLNLVHWSVVPRNPAATEAALNALISKYPGGDIEKEARSELARLMDKQSKETLPNGPGGPLSR
jgi:hypothetical protein